MPANGSQGGASGVLLHLALPALQPYSRQTQSHYAKRCLSETRFSVSSKTHGRQLVSLFVAHLSPLLMPFLLPVCCIVYLSLLQVAQCQSCFVPSGAAHNSRSTAGTPSALHQQHLTPAQQATQAAITAPATHQDGKVPVRTGLAWAALGTPFFSFSCMSEMSQPPRFSCISKMSQPPRLHCV